MWPSNILVLHKRLTKYPSVTLNTQVSSIIFMRQFTTGEGAEFNLVNGNDAALSKRKYMKKKDNETVRKIKKKYNKTTTTYINIEKQKPVIFCKSKIELQEPIVFYKSKTTKKPPSKEADTGPNDAEVKAVTADMADFILANKEKCKETASVLQRLNFAPFLMNAISNHKLSIIGTDLKTLTENQTAFNTLNIPPGKSAILSFNMPLGCEAVFPENAYVFICQFKKVNVI